MSPTLKAARKRWAFLPSLARDIEESVRTGDTTNLQRWCSNTVYKAVNPIAAEAFKQSARLEQLSQKHDGKAKQIQDDIHLEIQGLAKERDAKLTPRVNEHKQIVTEYNSRMRDVLKERVGQAEEAIRGAQEKL
ncbi:MAG: hypothetical protein Q9170_005370 [Blastenia crenularia]